MKPEQDRPESRERECEEDDHRRFSVLAGFGKNEKRVAGA
jgi:hypothetical protein